MAEPSEEDLRVAREIVAYISNAAIELAFVRHELTTTEYEGEEYPDVEEGVEALKALVESVKADVLACLTGDETGCLDPEDVDYDNEMRWVERRIATALSNARAEQREVDARIAEKQAGKGRTIGDTKAIARAIRAGDKESKWSSTGKV